LSYVAVQKNEYHAVPTALKFKLKTKNINSGTKIVNIPKKYAKYGDNIFILSLRIEQLNCSFLLYQEYDI
jgi:hypothetical protein